MTLRLTEHIDFGTLFDAEAHLYTPEWLEAHYLTRENVIAFGPSMYSHTLGFEKDGKPIGGICVLDQEFHIAVLPEYHGRWGRLWQPALSWLLSIHDPIYARPETRNTQCIRFLEHAQFCLISQDDDFTLFYATRDMMARAVHGKGQVDSNKPHYYGTKEKKCATHVQEMQIDRVGAAPAYASK